MGKQPVFDFKVPRGYQWLLDRHLVDYSGFGPLQPWHYLDAINIFSASEKWPNGPCADMVIAFARRQDNDDIACFQVVDAYVVGILIIHGWTSDGYEIVASFSTFWEWLKSAINDIAQWVDSGS